MSTVFNAVLTLICLGVIALLALMGVGLGYFFMTFGLTFGPGAIVGLIAFIALLGVAEGSLLAVMTAPFVLIRRSFGGGSGNGARAVSDAPERRASRLISLSIGVLMSVGASVALVQFLLTRSAA